MDLFGHADDNSASSNKPLAEQMRPKEIDDLLGQSFLAEKGVIRQLLKSGKLPSLILWGPPGTGKTSFANLLASSYGLKQNQVNAVSTGAKDLRALGEEAHRDRLEYGKKNLLFIDEIHRLNKAQQDVLLPFVERGDIMLVGATTENPSFEVNSALMSRCRLVKFDKLNPQTIQSLIEKAAAKKKLNLEKILSEKALARLSEMANGDARKSLNLAEQLFDFYEAEQAGADSQSQWPLDEDSLTESLPAMDLYYDRSDEHYDTVSAFIKSIRATDPDAALYYLARMIKGGEDPKFIARRLIISASEDVGNADPKALGIAIASMQAVEYVGLPEAGINLAQATSYLAAAPKSNRSYEAYNKVLSEVTSSGNLAIPMHLRNAPTKLMKDIGYGKDYKYAHNYKLGEVKQSNLPTELSGRSFYEPKEQGYEKHIKNFLDQITQVKNRP